GKFRGGLGISWVFLVVNAGQRLSISFGSGGGPKIIGPTVGMSGGYPGGYTDWHVIFSDTNALELIEKGMSYPTTLQEIMQWIDEGKLKVGNIKYVSGGMPSVPLKDGDLYLLSSHGEAGWGDPIERDPELIEDDLNNGWMTPEVAKGIYGGVAQFVDGKWKVDEQATLREREKIRQTRREKAQPFKEWWVQERTHVLNKEFREEVRYAYQDVLNNPKSGSRFRGFWRIGEDYQL
ncbi:MAG: hypothetical protein JSV02_01410, partial [Dehalococcoidia bacterium]